MVLARLQNVAKSFGSDEVLRDVTWQVDRGQKIGMVGENGAGKSTLFRIIAGACVPDRGTVTLHRGIRVGLLEQSPELDLERSAHEEVLLCRPDLLEWERRIEELAALIAEPDLDAKGRSRDRLLTLHADALEAYQRAGGLEFDARVGRTLAGLGLPADHHTVPLGYLSGGQRSRVALAKVLMDETDLLLLDEPTNHLDIDAMEWLQEFLRGYDGGFVAISHDRYFLDAVADRIVEVEDGSLSEHAGGYTAYSEAKDRELQAQAKAYEVQQRYLRRQEEFIRRMMQRNTEKAVRVGQSRAKMIAKLEKVERPTLQRRRPLLRFAQPKSGTNDIVQCVGVGKQFGERVLFSGLDLMLNRGNRVGIVGPNGTGKTTLLRMILGEETVSAGTLRLASTVRVGYYAQDREEVDPALTTMDHVGRARPDLSKQEVRDYLARFLFFGDDVFLPTGVLSGGERSRVALALLILSQPDFLVLDEPTNHLDTTSREVFEDALVDYTGTILMASHDRYFLDRTVDRLLILGGSPPEVFLGNYSALQAWREAERQREQEAELARRAAARRAARQRSRVAPKPRVTPQPTGPRPEEIERSIAEAEARLSEVSRLLGSSQVYADGETVRRLSLEYEDLTARLSSLYARYLEAAETDAAK